MNHTTVTLPTRVIPGSSRNQIVGWLDKTLKIKVTVPAERGKANAAVELTLAKALGIPAKYAQVTKGKTSTQKVIEITGLLESEVYRRISKSLD